MTQICPINPQQVTQAFLAATPLINQSIKDFTVKHPSFLMDVYEQQEWAAGSGTVIQELIFRGEMPQIERGFDRWKKLANLQGCAPCEGPGCDYNITQFGGTSFDRKLTELMRREFVTPKYCVSEIQTTANFEQVFAKIVENIWAQTSYFKEFSIAQNTLTMLAKKFVVTNAGAQINRQNIYVYPNIGTATLSAININMLEFFYEQMRKIPSVVPYDVVDGAPLYALHASHQLLARMYRDDQNLRKDVRFSGLANDLVMKYNFMSSIRGMFLSAPTLYPRRFRIVDGEPIEVLPFVNGVPAAFGTFTDLNPHYDDSSYATHEEIIIHGKYPFKLFYQPTVASLGENTSFGPEFSFMDTWVWINPLTDCDFFRRTGFFATSAAIGISQQFSDGIFSILVERPSVGLMFMQNPSPVCPEPYPDCNNAIPEQPCPCPFVVGLPYQNPINGQWFFQFSIDTGAVQGGTIQLALDNGAYITATVNAVSSDGQTLVLTLPAGFTGADCGRITAVYCDETAGCSATVICANDCRSNQTDAVKIVLSNLIKATTGDTVLACFGDGTSAELEILDTNLAALEYVVGYASGYGPTDDPTGEGETLLNADMVCDRLGILRICVPPSTDATCPECDLQVVVCEYES